MKDQTPTPVGEGPATATKRSRRARRRPRAARGEYRGGRGAIALLVALLCFLLLLTVERTSLLPALGDLEHNGQASDPQHLTLLGALLGAPLLAALVAYLLAARVIRFARLAFYGQALRRYLRDYLRVYAPLYARGLTPSILRLDASGEARMGGEESLAGLLASPRSTLLLGESGAGKTTTLHLLAYELTRWRALLGLALGRAPLPVLVPLATYTQATSQIEPIAFLMEQVRLFGSDGLARQLPALLHDGRALLLCDGLDDISARERLRVSAELARFATGEGDGVAGARVIATCDLSVYSPESRPLSPLREFERAVVSSLRAGEVARILRAARAPATRSRGTDPLGVAQAHRLDASLGLPAALAALVTLWESPRELPFGRGALYLAAVEQVCQRAALAATDKQTVTAEGALRLLGELASSLRRADAHALPITPPDPSARSQALGASALAWLERYPPLAPTEARSSSAPIERPFTQEEAQALCEVALRSGALFATPDGRALRFAHPTLEASFAAAWLRARDDRFGRLNAELLRPQWTLCVLLWAGALEDSADDSADLVARLLRLAYTPDALIARAGLTSRAEAAPTTLSLTLAALVEGMSARLAHPPSAPTAAAEALEREQQRLRDLLDLAQSYLGNPAQQPLLANALTATQREGGPEVVTNLAYLASFAPLSRLARAQVATLLGLIDTPAALDALVGLLNDPDPVMLQATHLAFAYAGARALPALEAQAMSANERVRVRAREALQALGGAAEDAAIADLEHPNPQRRAVASQKLGALHARQSEEALARRLDDGTPEVRIAAAQALGQLGGEQAVSQLARFVAAPDVELRIAIAQALGLSHDASALAPLTTLLDDGEGRVRAAAATALGQLGDERAAPALHAHTSDPDPWAQNATHAALRRLGRE